MYLSLRVKNFKGFGDTTILLSPFTLLVGANASGKSNIRECFRFLNGAARGYTLAEIVGEKWVDGGVRVWNGIRGGSPHLIRSGEELMSMTINFTVASDAHRVQRFIYRIDVALGERATLKLVREYLHEAGRYVFDTHPDGEARGGSSPTIKARIRKYGGGHPPDDTFLNDRPILTQIDDSRVATEAIKRTVRVAADYLESMAFLDLSPHAAREASQAGITTLGDRGENLSSVLAAICLDPARAMQLTSWVRALTPMDVVDFEFSQDANGRIMAELVGEDGTNIPLTSASDGTVRFLAMIAALMNPERPHLLFFEELENGIHPNRVYLLLDLISQSVQSTTSQIIATSHSPQLLVHAYRTKNSRPNLVFRSESLGSKVVDVRRISGLNDVLEKNDPAALMAAGWFEDIAAFLDEGVSE